MKKLVSFALAAVLCVGMTTTVLAESPNTGNNSPNVDNSQVVEVKDVSGTVTQEDGTTVTLTTWESAGVDETTAGIPVNNSSDEWVEFAATEANVTVAEVDDVVKTYVDDNATGTVPVPVTGVTAQDTVVALIYDATNDVWTEAEDAKAENGVVNVTNSHFCPVVILVDAYEAPVVVPPYVAPVVTPVAPKTADVAMLGMAALATLAGAVVAGRKVKASK